MKTVRTSFWVALALAVLSAGLGGCFTEGYIGVSNGVYYGPHRDPWFRDDPWMDGHRWYGGPRVEANGGIYIHPPRGRR